MSRNPDSSGNDPDGGSDISSRRRLLELFNRLQLETESPWLDVLQAFKQDETHEHPISHSAGIRNLISHSHTPQNLELQTEIFELRKEITQKSKDLISSKAREDLKDRKFEELRQKYGQLRAKENLSHLLNRVGSPAQDKILHDSEFRAKFTNESRCAAFVLSIDIRRSTELMLKAREPKLYAEFIIKLAAYFETASYRIMEFLISSLEMASWPSFQSSIQERMPVTKPLQRPQPATKFSPSTTQGIDTASCQS